MRADLLRRRGLKAAAGVVVTGLCVAYILWQINVGKTVHILGHAKAGDDDPRGCLQAALAKQVSPHAPVNLACTRRSAVTASSMSSAECAGESGSERISCPARSATGSGSWSG